MHTLMQRSRWGRYLAVVLLLSCILLGFPQRAFSQVGTFTTFDVPGASYAFPLSMNEEGDITGYYFGAGGYHGFVRDRNGIVTTFDAPGAVPAKGTFPNSVNEEGMVVGTFYTNEVNGTNASQSHGFVRDKQGTITTLDGPPAPPGTAANSINEDGVIIGTNGFHDAFVLRTRRPFTLFRVPDATSTVAVSINGEGVIAGSYYNNGGYPGHGFVRDAHGVITTFDAPGSEASITGTLVVGINDWGTIVGEFFDENLVWHGFVRDRAGTISTFEAVQGVTTLVFGINNEGTIVGYYGAGLTRGFVRDPRGSVTTFEVPGSFGGQTQALSINDEGDVAGNYEDANFATHCFVWRREE